MISYDGEAFLDAAQALLERDRVTTTLGGKPMGTLAPRRTAVLAGVLAAALAVAACGSSSSSTTSSRTSAAAAAAPKGTRVKIGVIGSLTGLQASSCDQGATVAPAWADWINANGGIDGHPVETIVLDDKGDPATAQAAERQLASDGVAAIIVSCDNEVSAYDSAAIASGIPLIGGTSNVSDWYTKPGMFPTMTGILNGLRSMVTIAVRFGHAKKFASLYCAETAACGQANPILAAAAKAAGIGFTELAVSATAPSYTAQCLLLKQENVDYAQINFSSAVAERFVQDCQAQGYNPTWGSSEQAIGGAYTSMKNVTIYAPAWAFPSVAKAAPADTFRTVMRKYAANDNWQEGTASFTWDGLQALAQALRNAHVAATAPVTSAEVMTGLYAFKDENLGGELANVVTYTKGKPFGFTANPCYFVVEVKNGQTIAPAGLTPQCPAQP